MPQHDVIDNRSDLLIDRLKDYLADSEAAHFAVGYFFLSGFKAIAPEVGKLKKLRLLIGNTTSRETLEQIVEGYGSLDLAQRRQRAERMNAADRPRIQAVTADAARDALALMPQDDDEQQAALSLARGIAEGRIEVRVYTKGRLHAKAYIFDYDSTRIRSSVGAGIIGSSNFSISGIVHNTELNAALDGNANHTALLGWFDELWDESEDFSAALVDLIEQSWVANPVTPYDIYLKTLYTLVKDRLADSRHARLLWEAEMPPLADFQRVAVEQARRILSTANGVFISDVVGFGKTFIGAALLKHWNLYENAYAVVICPRSLVAMWENMLAKYGIWGTVLSLGALSQRGSERLLLDDPKYSNAGIVLIDESHNLRSPGTQRYQTLQRFTQSRPCILLTATPRNTSAWDVYHQVKLWHPDDRTTLLDPPNPPNLAEYFNKVEPRNGSQSSASMRDLLDKILIRRTRRHVLEFYGESDAADRRFVRVQGKPMYFPDRRLETVSYSIEATYGAQVYAAIRDLLSDLSYARYTLYGFVLPPYRKLTHYQKLKTASGTLRGLMRILLFKRFESSVAAFRATLNRLQMIHRRFVEALDAGFIPAGEDAQAILYDTDSLTDFADLEDDLREASQEYQIEHFNADALRQAIAADLLIFERMAGLIEPITPELDDKLIALQTMLRSGRDTYGALLPGTLTTGKVLIFTEYSDTAQYLYENLRSIVGEKDIRKVDSGTRDMLDVVGRFAPRANRYTLATPGSELRVLVTTDVLSEGLNLQDGDHLINYDLHWNPVRLIQRVGRVDRLGSLHERVHAFNFLPETGVEQQLGLQERLAQRIQDIHNTIGEDSYILSRSEQLNEEAMYAIYQGDAAVLDQQEGDDEPFSLLEAETIIRQLRDNDPDRFERIRTMPDGVRSSRASLDQPGTFVLCEAQDKRGETRYRRLFFVDNAGKTITNELPTIIRAIRCALDEERLALPMAYNAVIQSVHKQFEKEVRERQSELRHTSSRGLGREYALQQLRVIYEQGAIASDQQLAAHLSTLFAYTQFSRRCHNELNALRVKAAQGDELLEQLRRIALDYGLEALHNDADERDVVLITRVICSEALS